MSQEEKYESQQFSFSAYAWSQFKKNRAAYASLWVLGVLAMVALFAPILANDEPLYANYNGNHLFPAFSFKNKYELTDKNGRQKKIQLDIAKWKQMELESVVWAPVVYSPNKSDFLNSDYKGPSDKQLFKSPEGKVTVMPTRFKHWLGTNKRGEDVLSGLIHASRISLTIGIFSMGVASIIGLILGSLAGYFGDHTLTTKRGTFWTVVLGLILAYYYGFMMRSDALADSISESSGALMISLGTSILVFIGVLALFYLIGRVLSNLPFLNKETDIPLDSMINRLIEILISMPRIILILSIAAIAKPSITNLVLIIGFTSWTGIARITRAEFLKIRSLEYIQAGRALGFDQSRIIFKHALPNGIAPALVIIAFGVASSILVESSLSFLGIGVPADTVTWGSLISSGRQNFSAWWLVIFPGLAILLTVSVYNLLGEGIRDAIDPRLKK